MGWGRGKGIQNSGTSKDEIVETGRAAGWRLAAHGWAEHLLAWHALLPGNPDYWYCLKAKQNLNRNIRSPAMPSFNSLKKIFTPACKRHRSIQQLADCKADPPQIIPRDPGALPIDFLRPCFVSTQRVTSHEDISHFAFHSPRWDTGNYLSPLLGV